MTFGRTLEDPKGNQGRGKTGTANLNQPFDLGKFAQANSSSAVHSPVKELTALQSTIGVETQNRVSSLDSTGLPKPEKLGKCECVDSQAPAANGRRETEMIMFRDHANCRECGAYAFRD